MKKVEVVPKRKLKKNQSHHLNIPIGADLILKIKNIRGFFTSYLIGMKPKAFLIIKSPTILGYEHHIFDGTSLTVRYNYLGDIYRYKATVLRPYVERFSVTYLSYPDVVEKIESRESPRVSSYIPASLMYGSITTKGLITDISVAGCKFRTDSVEKLEKLIQKESDVGLHFPVFGLEGTKKFKGRIKKVSFYNDLALGIGFQEVEDDVRNAIASFIDSTLEYRDK
jgi:hypothetical protein